MKQTRTLQGFLAAICMAILILDSRTALNGAEAGLELCLCSLIPALFPYFIVTNLLTGSLFGTRLPLFDPLRKLFRIPAGCESILIPGFLGGYPSGAQCIGQAYQQNSLSSETAQRLLLFCSNAGPSFLFGVLGPIFPEKQTVWMIWGIQVTGCIVCARLFPQTEESFAITGSSRISLGNAVSSALRVMASVCGWVILFRICIAFLDRWFLWILPQAVRVVITGLLELSNGCCSLAQITDPRLRIVICSGMLSFGGLCVVMQTASVIGTLPVLPYFFSKLLQAVFCAAVSAAWVYQSAYWLAAAVLLWFLIKKVVEFRSLLMYNERISQRRKPYAVS